MSAAAISAIALTPSASWASLRFSLISFISAGLFGSSSIVGLKHHGAHERWRPSRRFYHASHREWAILGRLERQNSPFGAESALVLPGQASCAVFPCQNVAPAFTRKVRPGSG